MSWLWSTVGAADKLVGVIGNAQKGANAFANGDAASGALAISAAGGKFVEFGVKAAFGTAIKTMATEMATCMASEIALTGGGTLMQKALGKASTATVKGGPTFILDITAITLMIVELSTGGLGTPVDGSEVTSQSKKLGNAKTSLGHGTISEQDWSGSDADAYSARMTSLNAYIDQLMALDAAFAALVKQQATSVKDFHTKCSIIQLAIIASVGVALGLYFIPIVGPLVSMGFQTTAAVAFTATFFTYVGITAESSRHISNTTQAEVTQAYQSLQSAVDNMRELFKYVAPTLDATPASAPAAPAAPAALKSAAPAATAAPAVAASASAAAASAPSTPAAAASAPSAPAAAASAPSTPAAAAPSAPAPAASTAASGVSAAQAVQTATVLAPLGQSMGQSVNQGVSSIQQGVQQATQQANQHAQPEPHDDAKDGPTAQGASAGADGSERAPLQDRAAEPVASGGAGERQAR